MQSKTTRAFRTISEAAEELDLQPHVLRFWESKFSQITPIKRAGGRRLYRPEDIDLLRGIKILLHEEKHPIKDVQKIIRLKGPNQVVELGRSIKRAAQPKDVKETVLVPERIIAQQSQETKAAPVQIVTPTANPTPVQIVTPPVGYKGPLVHSLPANTVDMLPTPNSGASASQLESILERLVSLKKKWDDIEQSDGQ